MRSASLRFMQLI